MRALQPDPAQPRKYMDPVSLDEMTASVGRAGTGPGGGGLDRNRMVLSIIIRVAACVVILRQTDPLDNTSNMMYALTVAWRRVCTI